MAHYYFGCYNRGPMKKMRAKCEEYVGAKIAMNIPSFRPFSEVLRRVRVQMGSYVYQISIRFREPSQCYRVANYVVI